LTLDPSPELPARGGSCWTTMIRAGLPPRSLRWGREIRVTGSVSVVCWPPRVRSTALYAR